MPTDVEILYSKVFKRLPRTLLEVQGEIVIGGSVPAEKIINTIRLRPEKPMINLPDGWSVLEGDALHLSMKFHKLYPDGTDVIIEIKLARKRYEIWSNAEHRVSGPNKNLESISENLEYAIELAISEAKGWD